MLSNFDSNKRSPGNQYTYTVHPEISLICYVYERKSKIHHFYDFCGDIFICEK